MLKKSSKRFVSIVLAIAMILTMVPFAAFADETTASDLSGHWAENVITEWMDYGIINGYEDGTIRPNNKITRAEMTAMLDRVMDYQTKADNTFSDLGNSWYTDVILKANAAGVISGYPDGTVKPDATITRQEAVAMFSRVLSLDTKNAPEATFTDNADVAGWAKDAVNAMAAADYIHGSDGQFRPNDGITRAEVVTILNNIFDKLYQKAGEYTGDVDGSAVINTDQVTLKDMTISGDLIIAEGVGDGHVVLDNVTVDGKLIVRGGGENSVIIKGDSKIDNISVERIDGAVRVAVEDNASVNAVLIDNGGQDVKLEGTIDTVNVASANVNVDITGAAKDINVADTAKNATITVTSTATADNVSTSAENTTIIVAGTVSNIDIAVTANNSVVTTQSSATIDKVTTAAGNTTIEGSGTVTDVVVSESASDATVTTEGTKVENNSSSNVTTSDDSVIAPGTTDTTPGGTTETPSVPSVPSVPSGPSHTHNYVDGVCAADGAIDPAWAQVNSTESWNAAIEAGKNIVVTADFTTDAQLQITKAITVNGNGHTITAGTWTDANTSSKGDAHLVSINAGNDAVVIKNITLTDAKTINNDENNKDYASGLNVYKSSNVTLDKVTLKDNDAAGMIVNGSNVKATGLVTSGNGWGGVNVDKGTNVTDATTFTFDAASTFTEDAKVYSDAGNVTVNAPEGWACAQIDGKYYWAKLFEGGNGSKEKPYLISTAEQLAAIQNGTSNTNLIYYKLTADIDLKDCNNYGVNLASNIVFDGDNHKIYSSQAGTSALGVFRFATETTTIKNLVYDLTNLDNTNGKDDLTALIYQVQGLNAKITIEKVKIEGTHSIDSNNAPFVMNEFLAGGSTLDFINCEMAAKLSGDGYNACFIGWQGAELTIGNNQKESCQATITLNGCTVSGELVCPKASIVAANGTNAAKRSYTYTGTNELTGTVRGTLVAKYFTAVSESGKETLENAAAVAFNRGTGVVVGANDTGLSISRDSNGKLTITASSNSDVTSYEVKVGIYTTLYNTSTSESGGTWKFFAQQTVEKPENLTFYAYDFIDAGYPNLGEISTDNAGNKVATLDNKNYYVVKDYKYADGSGLQGYVGSPTNPGKKAAQIIQVTAYVGDTMYSTATLK